MKALEIARVNLLRQVRDRSNLFFVFVLPTIIVVALGLQFGGPMTARVGILTPAGDAFADALVTALRDGDLELDIRVAASESDLLASVERGQLEAGIVLPADYGAAILRGETVEVAYVGTADALTLGLRAPVEAAVARQAAIIRAARAATASSLAGGVTFDAALAAARGGADGVPGVAADVSVVGQDGPFAGFGRFTLGAQSQLILFMFLTSMTAATQVVLSRKLGVTRRMLSTATPVWTIVAGEALGRFGVAMLQAVYIVAVTSLAFGVTWGDPLAAGLIIVLFGIVAAGVAMLVGAFVANPDQAGAMGIAVALSLGALGGGMVPISTMPETMQSVARLVPHAWALTGLQSLVTDGGGVASVLPNLAVLAGWGVALLVLASWRFRRSIAG